MKEERKFAFIEYEREKKNRFMEKALSILRPFDTEKCQIFGADGFRIRINIRRDTGENIRKRVIKKLSEFLYENEVCCVTGEGIEGIRRAEGMMLSALICRKYVSYYQQALVICSDMDRGENEDDMASGVDRNITDMVLCAVCPRVRSISLAGCPWDTSEEDEYFFFEYGINIQHMGKTQKRDMSENFKQADIIIDCRKNKSFPQGKEKCLYISLFEESQRKRNWKIDGQRIDEIDEGEDGIKMSAEKMECVLCALSKDFLNLLNGRCGIDEKMKIAENMGISALTSH